MSASTFPESHLPRGVIIKISSAAIRDKRDGIEKRILAGCMYYLGLHCRKMYLYEPLVVWS
jgi:hypothetical protein